MRAVIFSIRFLVRGLFPVVCIAALSGAVRAECLATDVIGQWRQLDTNSRWYFFSNNEVDCRTCRGWAGTAGCQYVPDATDELNRQKCTFGKGGAAPITVTGWRAKDGKLDALVFSDGSVRQVGGNACRIDGGEGIMAIEGVGRLQCHYNYQCQKLDRENGGSGD